MSLHLKAITVVVFLISQCPLCLQATPSFRIIAPQTICKHENNGSLTTDPQAIIVGLQPRDGMKLSYKVRIFFKSAPNRVRSQRNTLLVWKAIRSLENRINVKERIQISKQNMLSINKSEVEPGVIYMFHIMGITDAGEVSKQQLFTIKYTDGVLERNDTKTGLNFLLIGTESTVASIPYTITARLSFCKPRYDYYLRWKMLGLDEEFQDVLHTTGTVLKIPPNSLIAGKEYEIQATVIQSDNSLELAQELISVEVMKKGFQAYIIPTTVKIGLNKPAIFEVFIQDFDNICESLDIIWECNANDGRKCPRTESVNLTKFEFVFTAQGSYEISATLKLGELIRSIRAEVTVDPKVYVSFEFSNIPSLVPSAGQALHFSVLMIDLIPNCKAGWSTAQEEGFIYIPPEEIGEGFGTVEIKDLEKEYLSEIADFGNSTSNKEIVLNIPEASDGKWKGLKGDSNYKFRLDTVCPVPYNPNDVESANQKVVSSFEFVVYTNSPPMGGDLYVKPLNGLALQTVFEISSDSAWDLLLDAPISYEFLIKIGPYNISLGKFYEFKSLDTQLPYSEPQVQVMSRVCDIRSACNINFGPIVKVVPVNYSQKEIELLEMRIKEAFQRTDFNEALNLMIMAGITYKNSPNTEEVFQNFKVFATNLLRKEIDKQYESPTEKYYISKEDIVNFISQTKVNLEILDIKDALLLEKLLDLLDLAAEENDEGTSANIESFRRKKRDIDSDSVILPLEGRSIIDAAYVRMNLNLIEKIMQSYKDGNVQKEKAKIAQKIPVLASKMCSSDLITKESIYSSVAAIDVEKMTGNHMIEKSFTIPNYFAKETGNFKIKIPSLKSRVKYYCTAFIQFPEDYFDGAKQVSYKLQIIDLATNLPIKEVENPSDGFVVAFKISRSDDKNDLCLMREMEQWSPKYCSTKQINDFQIICECRNFGFLKTGRSESYISDEVESVTLSIKPATNSPLTPTPPNLIMVSEFTKGQTSPRPIISRPATTEAAPRPQSSTNTKDKEPEQQPVTASILGYVIPLIGLLVILSVIGVVIFYKRRKRNILGSNIYGFDIMETYPRVPRPGLKYAKFYDEHLMTGNFNTSAS